jgi:hypothetical protein
VRYRVEATLPVVVVAVVEANTPEEAEAWARDRAPFAVEFPAEGEGSEWESVEIVEVSEVEVEEADEE